MLFMEHQGLVLLQRVTASAFPFLSGSNAVAIMLNLITVTSPLTNTYSFRVFVKLTRGTPRHLGLLPGRSFLLYGILQRMNKPAAR